MQDADATVASATEATDTNGGLAQQRAQQRRPRHKRGAAGYGPASRAGYAGVTAWHKEAAEAT